MRTLLPAAILLAALPAEPGAARANPIFAQALSDSQLAASGGGHAIGFQLAGTPQAGRLARDGLAYALPAGGTSSIRAMARDAGVSSLSQALISLSLSAALNRPGF